MALIADRVYGPFFLANLISNCGNWIHNVAAAVVVFQLTGSALAVGAVTACLWGGSLLLQPWAGSLADRYDRRRLLIAGQTVALAGAVAVAVPIAVLGVGGLPGPWPVYLGTAVIGIGVAFSIPAMLALIPALVTDDDLDEAIALNSLSFNLARALGPALAGLVLVSGDAAVAFAINGASFAILIAVLVWIRPRFAQPRAAADASVRAGLAWLRSDPRALVLLATMVAIGFATDPINTLTPPIADLLGEGADVVGLFVTAFGTGAVVLALLTRRIRDLLGRERAASAGLGLLGLGIIGFGFAASLWQGVVAMVLAGAGFIVAITSVTTQLQERVPDQLRGRVMALWGVAFLGTRPISAAIDGGIADAVSPRAAAAAMAATALAAALVQRFHSDSLWVSPPRRNPGTSSRRRASGAEIR